MRLAIKGGVKMTVQNVLHIWEIDSERSIPHFTERLCGSKPAYRKQASSICSIMLREWISVGIPPEKLCELTEAVTKVGILGGLQREQERHCIKTKLWSSIL